MLCRHLILQVLCIFTINLHAQDRARPSLKLGDPAPPLRLRAWLKGAPIENLEKGKVYVLEFWATWCAPCRNNIPRLSVLAKKFRGKVTIASIGVYEEGIDNFKKIKTFVDSMGSRMDYAVASEDSNFMATDWLNAFGESAIPHAFVVNAAGQVAWIGHPRFLENILPQVLNNTWDIQKLQAKRERDRYLDSLDREMYYRLLPYRERPDLALMAINSILINEPLLEYAPVIASQTFSALLKTDMQKAYEYGKMAIVTPTYDYPAFSQIIGTIKYYSDKLQLPPQIYQLGAEAVQELINSIPFPEEVDMSKYYTDMTDWYERAGDKSKAIAARQKAAKELKRKKTIH